MKTYISALMVTAHLAACSPGESPTGLVEEDGPRAGCSGSDRVEYTVRVRTRRSNGSLVHEHEPRLVLWDTSFGPSPEDDVQPSAPTVEDGTNLSFWYPNEFLYEGVRRRHGLAVWIREGGVSTFLSPHGSSAQVPCGSSRAIVYMEAILPAPPPATE